MITLCKPNVLLTVHVPLDGRGINQLFSERNVPWNEAYLNVAEADLNKIINVVLYLCSDEPDIANKELPGQMPCFPGLTKTKKGQRLFSAPKTRTWKVAGEIGAKLRGSRNYLFDKNKVTPHLRRAHWHGYWKGPKKIQKQTFSYKWLPPIFVGDDEIDEHCTL